MLRAVFSWYPFVVYVTSVVEPVHVTSIAFRRGTMRLPRSSVLSCSILRLALLCCIVQYIVLVWFPVVLVLLCFGPDRALIMRCSFKFWLHLIIVGCWLEVACLVTTDDVGSALLCFALPWFVFVSCLPTATLPVDNLLTASFPLEYLSLRTSLLPTHLILP
jgi:hypothetical protein